MVSVSIIVPCHNVVPYLARVMLSLVNQSMTDIEIICIDDASTDETLDALREWKKCDTRVVLIENKKSIGLAKSMNKGIDAATGKYVAFVHPTDFVNEDFFEKLLKFANISGCPVVAGQVILHETNGKDAIDPDRTLKMMRHTYHNFKYPYTAIYLRDFLNKCNIKYLDLSANADIVFEAMVKRSVNELMGVVDKAFYHRYKLNESLDEVYWDDKKIKDSIRAIDTAIDIYNSQFMVEADYAAGAWWYFNYLLIVTMNKNTKMRHYCAEQACSLFKKMNHNTYLKAKNSPLFVALCNNDADGVLKVLDAQRQTISDIKLLGFIKASVQQNATDKTVKVFGVPVYVKKIRDNK